MEVQSENWYAKDFIESRNPGAKPNVKSHYKKKLLSLLDLGNTMFQSIKMHFAGDLVLFLL